jgi:hypothetical protein
MASPVLIESRAGPKTRPGIYGMVDTRSLSMDYRVNSTIYTVALEASLLVHPDKKNHSHAEELAAASTPWRV